MGPHENMTGDKKALLSDNEQDMQTPHMQDESVYNLSQHVQEERYYSSARCPETNKVNLEVKDAEFLVVLGTNSIAGKTVSITIEDKVKDFAPKEFKNLITGKSDHQHRRKRKLTFDDVDYEEENQDPHFDFSCLSIRKRIDLELRLCISQRYWWQLPFCLFCIFYVFAIVCRNLAFYLHEPLTNYVVNQSRNALKHHRLYDIGFSVTPDWSRSSAMIKMNEAIPTFMCIFSIGTSLFSTFYTCTRKRPFFFNMHARFWWVLTTGHAFRALCYLSTSIPGPAAHCIDVVEDQRLGISIVKLNQPKNIWDIFTSANHISNCGDAVFSGHMLLVTTSFLTVTYYFNIMTRKFVRRVIRVLCLVIVVSQAFLVLATRNHYTLDVILGVIIGALNWYFHLRVLRPVDPQPPPRALSLEKYPLPFYVKSNEKKS